MDAIELRPLTLGELLDRAFTLYRRDFWLYVGIMAIPAALTVPFTVLIFSAQNAGAAGATPSLANIGWLIFVGLTFLVLSGIVYPMAMGATTFAVSQSYLGQTATVRGAYGKVRGKVGRIWTAVFVAWLRAFGMIFLIALGAGIILGVVSAIVGVMARGRSPQLIGGVVLVGAFLVYLVALVLGGVWALRYAVCIPALLLENLGSLESLRRSVQLTQNRRWQIFVAVLLAGIIGYVGVLVFQGPFFVTMMFAQRAGRVPPWITFSYAVSGAVGGAITGPVLIIVLVLLYYDTRIRKEAFDLQFMMSTLDNPAPAQGTPSPA